MKRWLRFAAIPALIAALWLGGAAHAVAAEVIEVFVSDVQLAKDGELTVAETIRVRAEGREIRHGIYRDFPLTFQDAGGNVREVTFHLLGVSRDGKPEPYFTKHVGNALRIYAGDKDTYVRHGEHTYVFRYRTGRQVRWFDGKPELNWNVTGNFWHFPILSATYHLHLVDNLRPERFIAFTGRMGARGTRLAGHGRRRRRADGRDHAAPGARRRAHRGGRAARRPRSRRRASRRCCGGRSSTTAAGFSAASASCWCSVYYFAAWRAVGRDPKARHHHPAVSSAARTFRRRSPTTSTAGASAARNGAPSPPPRCRSRCAG